MKYRLISIFGLMLLAPALLGGTFLPQRQATALSVRRVVAAQDFPQVDHNYVYDQLFWMVTHFLHREAGYDNNLSPDVNGHNEFATYWAQEMLNNLQGFGAQTKQDPFTIKGWQSRPATVPAFNVEVSVPGITHPEQVVVIGCHYDAMANSTQSANDDGSGCAIELAIAKAMADYWHANHLYPARTLRFVLFDAEEQGVFGSAHYVNATINGDLSNVMAMFNEEQNGIAYPLRYLGRADNPLLPLYAMVTPLQSNEAYTFPNGLSSQQNARITRFRDLMQQAPIQVFEEMQIMGLQQLSYHVAGQSDAFQPIFTPDQASNIQVEDDTFGHSDQVAFTLAGLPCATFEGNYTYYQHNPPPWSYPYDLPDDTIQLMNIFANGSSHKAQALTLSLTVPAMLTAWMLKQPDILGQVSVDSAPIVSLKDLGPTQTGQSLAFDASDSFQPASPAHTTQNASDMQYIWDFGDQSGRHSGEQVNHTYSAAGTYTLTLTVKSVSGQRRIQQTITVADSPPYYPIPYRWDGDPGINHHNYEVTLPTANDSLSDAIAGSPIIPTPTVTTAPTLTATPTLATMPDSQTSQQLAPSSIQRIWSGSEGKPLTLILSAILLLGLLVFVFASLSQRRKHTQLKPGIAIAGTTSTTAPPESPPGIAPVQEIASLATLPDNQQQKRQLARKRRNTLRRMTFSRQRSRAAFSQRRSQVRGSLRSTRRAAFSRKRR